MREQIARIANTASLTRLGPAAVALTPLLAALIAAWGLPFWPIAPLVRGGDQLGIQIACAGADRDTLIGWLTGPAIDERSFRPLCMLLHHAEFQFWGLRDPLYSWLSVWLHLANAGLLAALTAALANGSRIVKCALGLLAALIFAGPYFGDRDTLRWMVDYWPAQSDQCALLFALIGLILLTANRRAQSPGIPWLGLASLAVSCLFKEIGYAALITAPLLTWPWDRRNRGAMWGVIGTTGIVLALRLLALRGQFLYEPSRSPIKLLRQFVGPGTLESFDTAWPLIAAGATLGMLWLGRRFRIPLLVSLLGAVIAISAAAQAFAGHYMVAWMSPIFDSIIGGLFWWLLLAAGFDRFPRDARVRAIAVGWGATCFAVAPFKQSLGWYHYWPTAFHAIVVALLAPDAYRKLCWLVGITVGTAAESSTPEEEAAPARRPRILRWPAVAALALVAAACLAIVVAARIQPLAISPVTLAGNRWGLAQIHNDERDRPVVLILGRPEGPLQDRQVALAARTLARLGYVALSSPDRPITRDQLDRTFEAIARLPGLEQSEISVAGWGDSGSLAATAVQVRSLPRPKCAIDFAGPVDSPELPQSPILLACSPSQDSPILDDYRKAAKRSKGMASVFVQPDDMPVFPNETRFWMRSLHKAIEFVVHKSPPGSKMSGTPGSTAAPISPTWRRRRAGR